MKARNPPVYMPYMRPRFLMKSDVAVCASVAMARFGSLSIVFGDAELAIDPILLLREHEQLDHEHDQRPLRGHVEAEREAEHRDDDLVERNHEHVDHVAEDEPDPEMHQHQVGGLPPMGFVVALHGVSSR